MHEAAINNFFEFWATPAKPTFDCCSKMSKYCLGRGFPPRPSPKLKKILLVRPGLPTGSKIAPPCQLQRDVRGQC